MSQSKLTRLLITFIIIQMKSDLIFKLFELFLYQKRVDSRQNVKMENECKSGSVGRSVSIFSNTTLLSTMATRTTVPERVRELELIGEIF